MLSVSTQERIKNASNKDPSPKLLRTPHRIAIQSVEDVAVLVAAFRHDEKPIELQEIALGGENSMTSMPAIGAQPGWVILGLNHNGSLWPHIMSNWGQMDRGVTRGGEGGNVPGAQT